MVIVTLMTMLRMRDSRMFQRMSKGSWDTDQRQCLLSSLSGTRSVQHATLSSLCEHITAQFATRVSFSWTIIAVSNIRILDSSIAWVNNCLGLDNYRYFLLFILYLLIGILYNLVTIVSVWNHHSYKQHYSMMSFIVILDCALALVLVGFNGWNWFLALTGYSTIEFWGSTSSSRVSQT